MNLSTHKVHVFGIPVPLPIFIVMGVAFWTIVMLIHEVEKRRWEPFTYSDYGIALQHPAHWQTTHYSEEGARRINPNLRASLSDDFLFSDVTTRVRIYSVNVDEALSTPTLDSLADWAETEVAEPTGWKKSAYLEAVSLGVDDTPALRREFNLGRDPHLTHFYVLNEDVGLVFEVWSHDQNSAQAAQVTQMLDSITLSPPAVPDSATAPPRQSNALPAIAGFSAALILLFAAPFLFKSKAPSYEIDAFLDTFPGQATIYFLLYNLYSIGWLLALGVYFSISTIESPLAQSLLAYLSIAGLMLIEGLFEISSGISVRRRPRLLGQVSGVTPLVFVGPQNRQVGKWRIGTVSAVFLLLVLIWIAT